ncbi:hypothetical protein E0E62_12590 [Streptomyces sp. 16-176A]
MVSQAVTGFGRRGRGARRPRGDRRLREGRQFPGGRRPHGDRRLGSEGPTAPWGRRLCGDRWPLGGREAVPGAGRPSRGGRRGARRTYSPGAPHSARDVFPRTRYGRPRSSGRPPAQEPSR